MKGRFAAGDRVRRRAEVTTIEEKQGHSGLLMFRHTLSNSGGQVVEEDQIIVYREAAAPGGETPTRPDLPPVAHERTVLVDPVQLFRYSALTFNGHRIHYDYPYATESEHYPGLVIHGPLQATLLLNFAVLVYGRSPKTFSFRGTHPATGTQKLTLRADAGDDRRPQRNGEQSARQRPCYLNAKLCYAAPSPADSRRSAKSILQLERDDVALYRKWIPQAHDCDSRLLAG